METRTRNFDVTLLLLFRRNSLNLKLKQWKLKSWKHVGGENLVRMLA